MATGQSICERAMRRLMMLDTGASVSSTDQSIVLEYLNAMLDSWSTERLNIYSVSRNASFTLTPNLNPHTIGPSGATFTLARPPKIELASVIVNNNEYPLEPLTQDQWQAIPTKLATATLPRAFYYDPATSNGNLYLWPIPSAANTLVLYLWTLLNGTITWGTTLTFPMGYERAIESNLALELCGWAGRSATPEMTKAARESLAAIRAMNITRMSVEPDQRAPMGQGNGGGRYNIYNNRSRSS